MSVVPDGVLLDTDVFSYLLKGDTRSDLYAPHLLGKTRAISFMTLAELYRWALLRNWGPARRAELQGFLNDYLVLSYDEDLCLWWAWASAAAQRIGRRIETADAWIAATALLYDIPLLTHNPSDFAGVPDLHLVSEY